MKISPLPDGFILDTGNNALLTILWEEVEAIHFDRVDLPTQQSARCLLVFAYENGEFVEVDTGSDGFADLLSAVEKRFPMPEGWQGAKSTDGSPGSIDLWQRNRKQ